LHLPLFERTTRICHGSRPLLSFDAWPATINDTCRYERQYESHEADSIVLHKRLRANQSSAL
jgi:hypothetical protein